MDGLLKKSQLLLILLLALTLILVGCKEPEEEVNAADPQTDLLLMVTTGQTTTEAGTTEASTDASGYTTQLPPSGSLAPNLAFLGKATEIDQVLVTVIQGQVNLVAAQPLILGLSSYSGTLVALPIGPELTVNVKGVTANGKEIYSGSQIIILTGATVNLAINLNPIDDGKPNSLPIVSSITTPKEVESLKTAEIVVTISGQAGESYECVFSPDGKGGAYTPASIWITLGQSVGSCVSVYTAPDLVAKVSHEVAVTNDQGSTTLIGYDLEIVYQKQDAGVTVGIAPSIDRMEAKVTKKGVELKVKVSDDQTTKDLCYSWTYNGSTAAFKDATKSKVKFKGYDPAVGGTLQVTVRDEKCTGLSTTASFEVAVGQWPKL